MKIFPNQTIEKIKGIKYKQYTVLFTTNGIYFICGSGEDKTVMKFSDLILKDEQSLEVTNDSILFTDNLEKQYYIKQKGILNQIAIEPVVNKKTNYEKIKSMTIDEMVEFFADRDFGDVNWDKCHYAKLWLESESD